MVIQRIETFTRGNFSLVRVTTDDGSQGWGQIAPFHADISATVLHRQIAPLAIGVDIGDASHADIDTLTERCVERNHKFPWSYVCRAVAGIDTALWDMRGRLENRTVCELLGGTPRPFPAYGSCMRRDTTPDEEAQRIARHMDEDGFRAFKLKIGTPVGHNEDAWPGRTKELIRSVRAAIGPDVALLADANSCYTPDRAVEVGRILEANGGCHFEEPCPYWELEWTAEVADALDVPVAGGEQDNDVAQFRRMIRMNAVDIVQPDLCYVGGMSRALRVAKAAQDAGKPIVPHSANRSMVSVFTLHYLGAIANAGPYLEYSIEPDKNDEPMYEPRLSVVDGYVQIPAEEPGWGIRINPRWIAGAQRQVSERE
jgi:L-alanine-DL-glutamate epimerase-like enolase superfamily enzyme